LPKPVLIIVLVQRLATERDPPGDSCQNNGLLERVCLAVKVGPPGDVCKVDGSKALRA